MKVCSKCGSQNDQTSEFCQECGGTLSSESSSARAIPVPTGILTRIEQSVYFRIARGFAWFILILAILGFAGTAFIATSSVKNLLGGERSVTVSDVKDAIASKKSATRRSSSSGQEDPQFDPKAMGLLTTETGEIFNLLDAEQKQLVGGWDTFNRSMSSAVRGPSIDEQIGTLRKVREVVGQIDQPERMAAIREYLDLRTARAHEAEMRKVEAVKDVTLLGSAVAITAALITLVSMVLVLLAIERNTRRS